MAGDNTLEHALGSLNQIPPGEGRNFTIGETRIAVFRTHENRVFATQANCPHKKGPLADGLLGNSILICPLHEWQFDLQTGTPIMGECAIRTYAIQVSDEGNLLLRM